MKFTDDGLRAFSPRPPRLRVIQRDPRGIFHPGEYFFFFFFTWLLLIHTGSRSLSTLSPPSYPPLVRLLHPFLRHLSPSLPPSARRGLGKSGRAACTLFPSSLDAILISNSEKITLPSEPFKGLLGEIAPATCQPA